MKIPVRIIKRDSSLRKNYLITLEGAFILSILIFIVAFKVDLNVDTSDKQIVIQQQEEIFIEEIIQTKQELKAPAPPRPSVPIEVPNDEILEDEILEIDAEQDEVEEEIFVVVENPPVLIGGIASVQSHISYPPLALKAGIEGRVIVQFVIDKTGKVLDPKVIRGIGGGCDEEALKAVQSARFTPGMQRGRPVRVQYRLPIVFRLQN